MAEREKEIIGNNGNDTGSGNVRAEEKEPDYQSVPFMYSFGPPPDVDDGMISPTMKLSTWFDDLKKLPRDARLHTLEGYIIFQQVNSRAFFATLSGSSHSEQTDKDENKP